MKHLGIIGVSKVSSAVVMPDPPESTSVAALPEKPQMQGVAAVADGSGWAQSGVVMREADVLEELIQLRLENPGETRESALRWAQDMRRRYTPNNCGLPPEGRRAP